MNFTFSYVDLFFQHLAFAWPLLSFLISIIVVLGLIVGRLESWKRLDALYWAFVTATTVGYGDIRPKRHRSRLLAIIIALIGIIFTGILVALAINSARLVFEKIYPAVPALG